MHKRWPARPGRVAYLVPLVLTCVLAECAPAQEVPRSSGLRRPDPPPGSAPRPASIKRGLIVSTDAAFPGYTLFAPLNSTTTYLVDLQGRLVHSWPSKYLPGQAAYLLEDGSLLRAARQPGNRHFAGGGLGGRVERIAPDGKLLWEFVCADQERCQHHDIKPLPNGHVLLIVWEKKTRQEAIAAGRDPQQLIGDEMWPDCILEVEPQGTSGGRIVWEWHVWDHLIQDFDPDKPNYGVVAEHPELIDLNYRRNAPRETPAEIRRLRSLGYVGGGEPDESEQEQGPAWLGPGPGGPDAEADWCHINSIDYNPELDQIVLSVHNFNEIWIIDHSTSTEEAGAHSGGRYGKGGDLLYRWGNPRTYGGGSVRDQMLFAQHDACWIPKGSPGAGHLLIFNNGLGRPDGAYSSVLEIDPPVDREGRYQLEPGKAFGPSRPCWEYVAPNKTHFFSGHISGAQRLPNGNTLICSGEQGRLFEVDAHGKVVWEYVNPYIEYNGPREDFGPLAGGPRLPPPRRPGAARRDLQSGGEGGRQQPQTRPAPWGPPPAAPSDLPPWPPVGPPVRPPGVGQGGGLFRATRLALDHPGVQRLSADRQPDGQSP